MAEDTKTSSLVSGSVSRHLLRLSVPLLLSAALNSIQELIDLYWVSGLGVNAIASLAVAGPVLMQLFPVAMGIAMGMMSLMSRAVGAGRHADAARIGGRAIVLSVVGGLIVGAIGWYYSPTFCGWTHAPPEVASLAAGYLRIAFLGTAAIMAFIVSINICTSTGNTVIPMWGMIASNVINFVLAPWFIYGGFSLSPMGVNGAALARTVATACGAGIVICHYNHRPGIAPISWKTLSLHWPTSIQILKIGLPVSGQIVARNVMAFVLMGLVSAYGVAALAGYGIAMRFHMLLLMPAFAIGGAAAPIVGQNLGASLPARAVRASWMAVLGYAIILVAVMPSLTVFAPWWVRHFSDDIQVVKIASEYLRIVTPFFFFAGAAIILSRTMSSAGDTFVPMLITIVSLWTVQWPAAVHLPKFMGLQLHGIWWSIALVTALHGILIAWWFVHGKWKTRAPHEH